MTSYADHVADRRLRDRRRWHVGRGRPRARRCVRSSRAALDAVRDRHRTSSSSSSSSCSARTRSDRTAWRSAESFPGLAMETQGRSLFSDRRPRRHARVPATPAARPRAGPPMVRRTRSARRRWTTSGSTRVSPPTASGCGSTRSVSSRCRMAAERHWPDCRAWPTRSTARPSMSCSGTASYKGGAMVLHALRLTDRRRRVLRDPAAVGRPHIGSSATSERLPITGGRDRRTRTRASSSTRGSHARPSRRLSGLTRSDEPATRSDEPSAAEQRVQRPCPTPGSVGRCALRRDPPWRPLDVRG